MITFRKRVSRVQQQCAITEIINTLEPLSKDVVDEHGTIRFLISGFYPFLAYSRFLSFSEIYISKLDNTLELKLRPRVLLLFPLLVGVVTLGLSLIIGPISLTDVALIVCLPILVSLIALVESLFRTFIWWRRL